jgi:hypothetical protein
MTRRPRRVVPAIVLALVILAVCVVTAISVIQFLVGRPPLVSLGTLDHHLRTLHLDGAVMTSAGIVAAVLGLVLLGCAVIPGRAKTLPLAAISDEPSAGAAENHGAAGSHGTAVAGVSRSGLRTALASTVADIDGVTTARVRVRSRRVTLRVRTELAGTAALRDAVSRVTQQRLSEAGLARPPVVRLGVRTIRRGAVA